MKTISLFYRDGTSDKVYRAEIVGEFAGGYMVNFHFGRRGAKLAEGTKTRLAVPLAEAESIFAKLVAEKRGKGYTEETDGQPFGGDAAKLAEILPHPKKTLVTLAEARQWSPHDYLILRKYDGEFNLLAYGGNFILAEFMRRPISGHLYTKSDLEMFRRWPGGWWAALTVMECGGVPCLNLSTEARWAMLQGLSAKFTPDIVLAEVVTDVGAAMAAGAEGVVAHAWGQAWGFMLAHKAGGIWLCRVTRTGGSQSVGIADAATGADLGNVTLRGGKCDQVRVGSLIRVAGMGLTDAGKIRQPEPCRDWLLKV